MIALVVSCNISGEEGRRVYAPISSVRPGHVLVQPYVEGANALACALSDQLDTAIAFGMKPLYAVRVRPAGQCAT
ncbi:MAG: hypothetical protein PS018_20365 [bacterium]|nr:hypothetical protein [bacterium]